MLFGILSIKESEEPEGYLVAEAEFDVIGSNKAIGDVADLGETFPFATDFKQISVVDDEISFFAIPHMMIHAEE